MQILVCGVAMCDLRIKRFLRNVPISGFGPRKMRLLFVSIGISFQPLTFPFSFILFLFISFFVYFSISTEHRVSAIRLSNFRCVYYDPFFYFSHIFQSFLAFECAILFCVRKIRRGNTFHLQCGRSNVTFVSFVNSFNI